MRLRLGEAVLDLEPGRPLLMGIVNATPDSVSDSVRRLSPEARLDHAERLVEAGADIVDVGGESGRTDRPPISADEEIDRVVPLVAALAERGVLTSVDTWKPAVAAAAVAAGACLVNDVGGLADPEMGRIAAAAGCGLVVMETRAAPKAESFPGYEDPVAETVAFLEGRRAEARELGVADEQLVLDPGLDYAKTPRESLELLRRFGELRVLQRPLLLAVSNKYFIGVITDRAPDERLAGTLAAVEAGVAAGAAIVRVHDVAAVSDFLSMRAAVRSPPERLADPYDDDRLKWLHT